MMGTSRRVRVAAVGTAALLAVSSFLIVEAVSADAGGTTRYVATTGNDTDNDCTAIASPCLTIGHAIDEANANDTVSVGPGTFDEAVHITESITIDGAGSTGSGKTTIDGAEGTDPSVSIEGTGADSVPTVHLQALNISGNSDQDGILASDANLAVVNVVASDNDGSGITFQGSGTVSITDTTAAGNHQVGVALGPLDDETTTADAEPAVTIAGPSVTLSNDNFSNNTSAGLIVAAGTGTGTGLVVDGNGSGGMITELGDLTVSRSTFDHNLGLGVGSVEGKLTVNSSTISNTQRLRDTDSEALGVGAIGLAGATLVVNESTIYKNVGQGVLSAGSTVTVKNTTVVGTLKGATEESGTTLPNGALATANLTTPDVMRSNLAPALRTVTPQATVTPASTLIASGTLVADNATHDCNGAVTDHGYNLADDATCSFSATGSKNSGVAKLGSFGSHGGPTNTLVPIKGSDAIDKIPAASAGCTASGTDQRLEPRLEGAKCDIGAVEVHQTPLVITPASLPSGAIGKAYQVTFKASGGLGAPYVFSLAAGSHLPAGLTLTSAGVLSGKPTAAGTFTFTISVDDPTLKTYTITITGGAPSLADTGTAVQSMIEWGGAALGLGVIMMLAAGYQGRRQRR